MQSRQLLVGTLCKCKVYIKQHPILSSEKCLGLAGRAEILTKLSTDGVIAYTNVLLSLYHLASLHKESKLR